MAWGAIWEFTPLVIGSCQSAFLSFLPSTSLTARVLDSLDSYKIVNDIIWIWPSSCQPNVCSTMHWYLDAPLNAAQEVSILESILFLTLQKCVIHPDENFHEVYLKQMAKYTWAVRLSPTSAITNPKRFTLTLLSSVIL